MSQEASPLAVFFDLDGCLIDSRRAFVSSVNAALQDNGQPPRPAEALIPRIGPPLPSTFELLVAPDLVARCVVSYYEHAYADAARLTDVFEGIPALLESLAADLPLVVATSKPVELASALLEALDLRHRFVAVVGPPQSDPSETKIETMRRAISLVQYESAVMIGDTRFDIEGALMHALIPIGVSWGIGTEAQLREAGASLVVDSPAELEQQIRRIQRSAAGQAIR
ncbi:MAG TPA: HAD hydrolase-like protein [Baekduia sp.]|nr:HAD hydrolase-like protein [Baekduia sp.]